MQIDVTLLVPIVVDGKEIGEFDIAAQVLVTSWGRPATHWDPPEPMEYEIGTVGFYGIPEPGVVHHATTMPAELKPWADRYLDTPEAADRICDAIDLARDR